MASLDPGGHRGGRGRPARPVVDQVAPAKPSSSASLGLGAWESARAGRRWREWCTVSVIVPVPCISAFGARTRPRLAGSHRRRHQPPAPTAPGSTSGRKTVIVGPGPIRPAARRSRAGHGGDGRADPGRGLGQPAVVEPHGPGTQRRRRPRPDVACVHGRTRRLAAGTQMDGVGRRLPWMTPLSASRGSACQSSSRAPRQSVLDRAGPGRTAQVAPSRWGRGHQGPGRPGLAPPRRRPASST